MKATFRLIFSVLYPYKFYVFALLLVELVWAINSSIHPYLIKIIVDSLSHDLFDFSPLASNSFFLFIALSVIQVFVFRISDYLYAKMMPFVIKDTILLCFERVSKLPYYAFKDDFSGSIASRIYETADSIEYIFNIVVYRLISRILAFSIACFTISVLINNSLAIFLMAAFLFLSIFNFYLAKKPYSLSKDHMEVYILLVGNLVDIVSNILSVMLFSNRKYETKYLGKKAIIEARRRQKVYLSMLYIELGNALFLVSINLSSFAYSIYLYKKHLITLGDITFVLLIMVSLTNILRNIERDILKFLENFGKCVETFCLIDTPNALTEKKHVYPIEIKEGKIEFRQVVFGYTKNNILFDQISLKINAGQKVVCLGASGSGKSTFINLLLRLFNVNSGEILIDGQSITDVSHNSLYSSISLVPQEPILFNRSIFENIMYGRKSSEQEVVSASKLSLAHEFIIKLPNGYNTKVGERGGKLSGGQRKLVFIARVILKNNKILLFDELTSSLDIITKNKLKESLRNFLQKKTVVSITHDLEEIDSADRILLFDKGKIIVEGVHDELLLSNEYYKTFWRKTYFSR
jgi:ATP-binding cassette subfamily B protein